MASKCTTEGYLVLGSTIEPSFEQKKISMNHYPKALRYEYGGGYSVRTFTALGDQLLVNQVPEVGVGQPCPQGVWNILLSLSQLTPCLGHQGEGTEAGTYHPLSNVLLKGSFGMKGWSSSRAESLGGAAERRQSLSLRGGELSQPWRHPGPPFIQVHQGAGPVPGVLLCTWPGKQPTSGETSWPHREPQLP